ncbi:XdhC family protein [Fulvivirga sp. M361]|uniref:XdhC family protein n=1 Tax=Fulvivirga sp. M361 TaxID=2594266 RepID=UPI00117B7846|nr:XdhC family protein [Fulvivirga sp. M361]TRX53066.1 XdhC family protein [Fulvivirga sp. M361]
MNDFVEILKKWNKTGAPIALARVIKTWGSSPRPVGSVMMINGDGSMVGSVSGGCVEGAVAKSSKEVLTGNASKLLSYGISDEDAWSVGLSCGGSIEVFVQPVNFSAGEVWLKLLENTEANKSSILISSVEKGTGVNALINENGDMLGDSIPEKIMNAAQKAYEERANKIVEHEGTTYFIHIFPRKNLLLIIGAAHITVDLVALGNKYDFETVVIDPRGYFAQNTVFTSPPSQLLQSYPSEVLDKFPLDAYTFCAILSHDPKIDDNALEVLLLSDAGYIGALGSRKTHAKRVARLRERGVPEALIDRIHAPIGMPIYAKSAKEIALSVMGEIIQAKNQFL